MRKIWMLALLLLLSVTVVTAQTDTCPALLDEAIEAANDNCDGLGRNEACYGYNNISAEFYDAETASMFTQPTDRVPVDSLRRIASLAADVDAGEVGVAMMKVQAMLPNTLPGQNVVFVLIGDVQLESATEPDAFASPADPIEAVTVADIDLHSGPAATYNVVGSVSNGATLSADGLSADGEWARVIVDEYPVWASVSGLTSTDALLSLPTITGENYGAMQAFTLTSGLGLSQCEDIPNSVMIQAPDSSEVTLNINGANVTIGSTVVVELTSENDLELLVLDGSAKLNDDQVILSGFRAWMPIDPETARKSGAWMDTEAMEDDRLTRIAAFERIAPRNLNYEFTPPTRERIDAHIEAGLLDVQNNFGALPPEEQRQLIPFESRLSERFAGIERTGILPRQPLEIERDENGLPILPRLEDGNLGSLLPQPDGTRTPILPRPGDGNLGSLLPQPDGTRTPILPRPGDGSNTDNLLPPRDDDDDDDDDGVGNLLPPPPDSDDDDDDDGGGSLLPPPPDDNNDGGDDGGGSLLPPPPDDNNDGGDDGGGSLLPPPPDSDD